MTQTGNEVPTAEVIASENGRLTIPAHVRRAVGIEPGQRLVVYVEDGRVMIEGQGQWPHGYAVTCWLAGLVTVQPSMS